MGKRDELIEKYADDLKNKCGMQPDMDLLTAVTIGCGPSIYNADASTAAGSQESELETVKNNFLIKKLGLADGPELMDDINSVIETYGRSERNKYRRCLLHAYQAFRQRIRLFLRVSIVFAWKSYPVMYCRLVRLGRPDPKRQSVMWDHRGDRWVLVRPEPISFTSPSIYYR